MRSSQNEEEDLEGIIDSLLELNSPQVIEEEKPENMATIKPLTTNPPVPVLMTVGGLMNLFTRRRKGLD